MSHSTFTEILEFLDQQDEAVIMASLEQVFCIDRRGLFNPKFVPYEEIKQGGYTYLKNYLQAMYEIENNFMEVFKADLQNLKSQITNHKAQGELAC